MSEPNIPQAPEDYDELLERPEHRWRGRLIGLAVLGALVAAGAYVLWGVVLGGGGEQTGAVQTVTVERGSITNTVSTTGVAVAQSTTDLSFDQSGTVSAVNVKLGQEVKAGDVLAEIDPSELQDAVTTAQVNLASAQNSLNQLLKGADAAELASADQSVVQAQATLDKANQALKELSQGPTDSEELSAEQAVSSAQAKLDEANRALDDLTAGPTDSERLSAEQAVSSAQAKLDEANRALKDLTAGPTDSEELSAEQAVSSAQAKLDEANRALKDLSAGPSASELLSAQQAVVSAQAQLDQAEAARDKLYSDNEDAIAAAQAAVTKAQNALDSAERAADSAESSRASAEASLTSAENAYCGIDTTPYFCTVRAAPISYADEQALLDIVADPTADPALASQAKAVLDANSSYVKALDSKQSADAAVVSAQADLTAAQNDLYEAQQGPSSADISDADARITEAQLALQVANAKLHELNAGPTESELADAQDNVDSAQEALDLASAKLKELNAGPTQTELANAHDNVDSAQEALDLAKTKLDELNEGPTESELADAQDNVDSAQEALDIARVKLDELNQPPTEDELAQAQSDVDAAAIGLKVAEAKREDTYNGADPEDVEQQRNQVLLAELSVERAQKNLEKAKLTAPFDGTVEEVNIQAGDAVGGTGATAAIVLNTPDAVRLDLTVSESDRPNIKVGQTGTATFDAIPDETFETVIDWVGTSATTTQGVVTYDVRASLSTTPTRIISAPSATGRSAGTFSPVGTPVAGATPSAGVAGARPAGTPAGSASPQTGTPAAGATPQASTPALPTGTAVSTKPLPGMNATVEIVVEQAQDVLVVPTLAVQTEGRQSVVEVQKDDGTTERLVVETGLSDGTNTEIVRGLEEGQTVIIPSGTAIAAVQPTAGAGFGQFRFGGEAEGGGGPVTIPGPSGGAR